MSEEQNPIEAALRHLSELKADYEYRLLKIEQQERLMRFLALSAFFLPLIAAFIWISW